MLAGFVPMIDLARLFTVWFDDPAFSVAEILAFSDDHLGRLAANNPGGAFDTILAQTDTAFGALGGTTSGGVTALAVQKARTQAKRAHLEHIKDLVSQRSGLVINQFKRGSEEWVEFFPQGVEQVRAMKEADVAPTLDRIIAASVKYLPALTAEMTALKTDWLTLSDAAAQQRGAASGAGTAQDTAMAAMRRQLMTNALTLALHFLGQEAMAPVYFDQSKLSNPQPARPAATPPAPPA